MRDLVPSQGQKINPVTIGMIQVPRYQAIGELSLSMTSFVELSNEGSFDKPLTLASKPHSSFVLGKVPRSCSQTRQRCWSLLEWRSKD